MRQSEVNDGTDIIRGNGNVFRDLGHPDADREQPRALLAAEINGVLDQRKLNVRAAREATGVPVEDFSRIRNANLGRFTIQQLMTILASLWQEVEVAVNVQRRLATGRVGARSRGRFEDLPFLTKSGLLLSD